MYFLSSDKVLDDATRDFEETLVEEERNLQLRLEEGGVAAGDPLGPGKENRNKMAEVKERISGLSAVRKAMKNGDMFSEHLFQEKFVVCCAICYTLNSLGTRPRGNRINGTYCLRSV